jgi:2OG-Fe(II) oxygenase superfamily
MQTTTSSFSFSLFLLLRIALLANGFTVCTSTTRPTFSLLPSKQHPCRVKHAAAAAAAAAAAVAAVAAVASSSSQRMMMMMIHSSRTATLEESPSPSRTHDVNGSISSNRGSGGSSITSSFENKNMSYLQPPPYLADLDIGASVDIDDGRDADDEDEEHESSRAHQITKLANDPPLFLVQNFLSREDCDMLMHGAALALQDAETQQGIVEHRVGSKVAWMGDDDNDRDYMDDDNDQESNLSAVNLIAGYTQHLSANLFLPHAPHGVQAERLQVVQYDQNGKFDIHHDGFNRTVTVLTYLNGVAGTWFPYVGVGVGAADNADIPPQQRHVNNQAHLLSHKKPGRDGLCMASHDDGLDMPDGDMQTSIDQKSNNHVVLVQPGDAIVFYNYQDHPEHGRIMSWKSLHCGLPATREKWIATNWLRANDDDDHDDDV